MFRYLKELFVELGKLMVFLINHWYISLPILILLLLLPYILKWLHVIFSHIFYSIRLILLCKKKHISFKHSKHGFIIEMKDETYNICFLWRNLRKKNFYLFDHKTAFVSKPTVQLLVGKGFGRFGGWKGFNKNESNLKKIHLPETHGELTFVVVTLAPIEVFSFSGNIYQPTGSGIRLQDKVFYFGTDFLHFISRNADL